MQIDAAGAPHGRKRPRTSPQPPEEALAGDFEALPDDILVLILCKLSSSSNSPADLMSAISTCKRFRELGFQRLVLANASAKCLAVRPTTWSEYAHNFLKRCVDAGNLEAMFVLGMIRFYCLEMRKSGMSLMAKAALGSHPVALYSLAVIQFNGSGRSKSSKDLRNAVALCARAASLGYIDAVREIGHCLQDGYGINRDLHRGRRFLIEASVRELLAVLPATSDLALSFNDWLKGRSNSKTEKKATALAFHPEASSLCMRPRDPNPANRFLVEWFAQRGFSGVADGLKLCSYCRCGRPETRLHEFRRCAVCSTVTYCSRACQALDWKLKHRSICVAADNWIVGFGDAAVAAAPLAQHDVIAENFQVALLHADTEDVPDDAEVVEDAGDVFIDIEVSGDEKESD